MVEVTVIFIAIMTQKRAPRNLTFENFLLPLHFLKLPKFSVAIPQVSTGIDKIVTNLQWDAISLNTALVKTDQSDQSKLLKFYANQ
jgi:hypothetical protein